ncbi:MAG: flagellar basal body P-ring formation chaperone FlgA [Holophagales bacterium]|jgi:flagella basal body P-ring formation protein FlgA|nr:flagellar basal body P-ring formation chaperone FlgA [Holophagales bacterium]
MRIFHSCLTSLILPAALWAQGTGTIEHLGAQALVFAENAARNFPGQYTIQISRPPTLPPLKPGKLTFEADRLSKQEPIGRFFVVFRVSVDGISTTTVRVELESTWSGALYQAKNALQRKAVITEADFETIAFDGIPPVGALKELPKDSRLRQPMNVGKLLTQMDVETIPLINSTDKVRVTLQNGALKITGCATARSNGAKGDRVRLEMDGSKKIVQAQVTGLGEAFVDVSNNRIDL